jgi:catechol 2,3-dioxygenase-like lactoylglutathione lyase family enzyme
MRLRQIALVARDLAVARAEISGVLGLDYAYDDPGVGKYGLCNAVFPVGTTFLEVVSPKAPGTTAERLLGKRGGDGGYMVILQVDDLAAARARVHDAGARVVDQIDRDGAAFTHIHPKDIGGAILSIDRMIPKERWEWGGPHWTEHVRTDVAVAIVGAELQAEDPGRMASRWAAILGRSAEQSEHIWKIKLDEGEIRFVAARDGRGEGLGGFDVAVRSPSDTGRRAQAMGLLDPKGQIMLSGTRVRLVAAA